MDAYLPIPRSPLLQRLLREPPRPQAVRASPRAHWYVVGTVCIGAFMGQLDASIVTLALPRIGADLHAGAGAVRWVALSYMLVLTGTLVAVGHLADRVGRKLLYTYGFAVFTVGSALCGLAPSLDWLIAARVLQGLGAAMLQANSVALIAAVLERRELARGLGVQGAAQAGGLALGPVLGGLLLTLGGWRLVFLVNVPAGVVGIALGWLLLPRSHRAAPADRGGIADNPAAAARGRVAVGGCCTATGVGPRRNHQIAPRRARVHRHRQTPRVRARGGPGFLDIPALARGLTGAGAAYLVMFGALYVLTYFLAAHHVPVAVAGLQLAALPVALGLVAPVAGRLAARGGDRRSGRADSWSRALTVGGLLLATLGLLALAAFHGLAARLAGLTLVGAGLGAFIPINNAAVMSAMPRTRAGVLSGILNTTRSLATAAGVALGGLLYAADGLGPALAALAAVALTAAGLASTRAASTSPTPRSARL